MQRLNESELDARIHRFLNRKLMEFPDIQTHPQIEKEYMRRPRLYPAATK
jgi:hypothetical protein